MGIISAFLDWFVSILLECVNGIKRVPLPNTIDWGLYHGVSSLISNREICLTLLAIHVLFSVFAYFCVYWDRVDYFIKKRAIHINDIPAGQSVHRHINFFFFFRKHLSKNCKSLNKVPTNI